MTALPPLGPVTHITQHCTATPEGLDLKAAQISAMDVKIFGQVSYHFVVELDGALINTLDVRFKGAHTGKHNTGNIGISYIGGIDRVTKKAKDTRTPAQKATLAKFYRAALAKDPGVKILGHRDWSPDLDGDGKIEPNEWVKMCPCFDVGAWLKAGMPV